MDDQDFKSKCLGRIGVMSKTTVEQVAAWIDFDRVKESSFLQKIEQVLQQAVKDGQLMVSVRAGHNVYLRKTAEVV